MGWILEASALIGRRKPCDGEAILRQKMKAVIKILEKLYPGMGFELVGQG